MAVLGLPKPLGMRRQTQLVLWLAWLGLMVGFSMPPLINHFRSGEGNNKDYDIWYGTGRTVLEGGDIYPRQMKKTNFEFLYPPAAAVFLAPFTVAGKFPFIVLCVVANSLCWVACVRLAVYLATGQAEGQHPLVYLAPIVGTAAYVCDTYLLGQPNLGLLVCMLGAFALLRARREWGAGALIAFAAAMKAFPIMAIGYLIYRRYWKATASLGACLVFFLVLLPAPFRGFERNLDELNRWRQGMLNYDTGTIAQRPGSTYYWKNQSLVASANRLLRAIPADFYQVKGEEHREPVFANVTNVEFEVVNWVIALVGLGLGFLYMAIMPPAGQRTPFSDAVECAMLLVMMTIMSPISWFYYGVWLLYPFTVVATFALDPAQTHRNRVKSLVWAGACVLMFNFVMKWGWLLYIRAIGFPFFGYLCLLAELGWILHVLRQRTPAAAPPQTLNAPHFQWSRSLPLQTGR